MELEQDFKVQLPKITLDKIFAAITIVTTNYFYKDVTRFVELCNILAGDDFQPNEFEPADADEMVMAMTEAMLLWPMDDDAEDTEFSAEIREYITQVLGEQGILKPFDMLRFAFDGDQSSRVDMQQSKTDDLRKVYFRNVSDLVQQLQVLPLTNGSTADAVRQLLSLVERAGAAR